MPTLACKPQSPFLYFSFQNYRYESQGVIRVNVLRLCRLFPGPRPTAAAPIYCAFFTAPDTDEAPWALLILGLTCASPELYTSQPIAQRAPTEASHNILSLSFYNSTVISASFPSPSHNLILFVILFKSQYRMTTFIFHTISPEPLKLVFITSLFWNQTFKV